MGSFAKHAILCHTSMTTHHHDPHHGPPQPPPASVTCRENSGSTMTRRRAAISAATAASAALGLRPAEAQQSWGTHSFIKEKYFMPGLSPEEAVERIRQTAEGMRDLRHMLDTMSWRYVLFYIRLKQSYLDQDLKNAISTLPESRRSSYIAVANELVDSLSEMDIHVRSPKVYESYLYYEKTLKSLDDLVAILA